MKSKDTPQDAAWKNSPKAQSAQIFYDYYTRAKDDEIYKHLKTKHLAAQKR